MSIHENPGALNCYRIHFTCVRLKCSDQIQMSAGTKQISIEERDWRSSAGADDIGLGGNGHGVGGCDCDLTVLFFYEAFGPGTRSSANQHTLEIADQRQHSQMCPRLATCTENS